MSRRKTSDIGAQQFYKFEKWILAESKLKNLSLTAKMLYMVIRDREEISLKNAKEFTDKNGCLFQYFDQVKAAELLGISLTPIKKAFKDLQEYKLIESVRQGQGRPNRIYVLEYEISSDTLEELSYEKEKASAPTEAKEITESNKSICNNKENYTCNTKKSEVEKTVKAIDILRENNIAIAKKDIYTINNTCTDLDKLRKAIEKLKASKSFGVMATINAYNSIGKESNNKTSNERPYENINNFKDLNPNKEKNIIRDGYMQRSNLDNDIESSPQTKTENDGFRPGTKSYDRALALGMCDIHGNKIK